MLISLGMLRAQARNMRARQWNDIGAQVSEYLRLRPHSQDEEVVAFVGECCLRWEWTAPVHPINLRPAIRKKVG